MLRTYKIRIRYNATKKQAVRPRVDRNRQSELDDSGGNDVARHFIVRAQKNTVLFWRSCVYGAFNVKRSPMTSIGLLDRQESEVQTENAAWCEEDAASGDFPSFQTNLI